MFSLIKKDLKVVLNKSNISSLVIFMLFALFVFAEKSEAGLYVFVTMTFAFSLSSASFAYDEKNNTDYVINSLPVTRRDVVIAKYLSILTSISVTLFATLVLFTLTNQIGRTSMAIFNLELFLVSSLFVIVMNSILFPLFFKFGYRKSNIIRVIIFMAFFALTNVFFVQGNSELLKFILNIYGLFGEGVLAFILIVVAAIILLVSMTISIGIYSKKEL